jgi:hypothetical protein
MAAQGKLFHFLQDSSIELIIISRCNLNLKQYKTYLDIAQKNFAKCIWVYLEIDYVTAYHRITVRSTNDPSNPNGDFIILGNSLLTNQEAAKILKTSFDEKRFM